MKVITEAILRAETSRDATEFVLKKGQILSPAAREYLSQKKIAIRREAEKPVQEKHIPESPEPQPEAQIPRHTYTDYETGAFFEEKPECMTQLHGNVLVIKNHPRIVFRGKLDDLQASVVLFQAWLQENQGSKALVSELTDVLVTLRLVMRCDVMDETFEKATMIGLDHTQLRAHSHNPMKFYNIKQMVLPDKDLGEAYARLNKLRTEIRETEIAAIDAYQEGRKVSHGEIIEGLNRLSSALHIMMCKFLAGMYND